MVPRRSIRRPGVQRATLAIPLPVSPTSAECAAILKALIKHLLFQRAQIPYLYDELLRAAQQRQRAEADAAAAVEASGGGRRRVRRRLTPKGDKRLLKFLEKAEELMTAIDTALCSCGVPRRAFILLGSSTTRPREVYELLLPLSAVTPPPAAPINAAAAAEAAAQTQQVQQAQRQAQQQQQLATAPGGGAVPSTPSAAGGRPKLSRSDRLCLLAMRQLVVAGAELPEGTAHTAPCKVFLLLEGHSSPESGSGSGSTEAQQPQTAQNAPPGFAVKRAFKLSMRRGVHLKVLLGQHPEPDAQHPVQQEEGQVAASAEADGGSDMETGSCSECESDSRPPLTQHLSQLPDAPSQLLAATPRRTKRQHPHHPHQHGQAAERKQLAGSLWFLCKTAPKGLNSGASDDGAAAGFEGI